MELKTYKLHVASGPDLSKIAITRYFLTAQKVFEPKDGLKLEIEYTLDLESAEELGIPVEGVLSILVTHLAPNGKIEGYLFSEKTQVFHTIRGFLYPCSESDLDIMAAYADQPTSP